MKHVIVAEDKEKLEIFAVSPLELYISDSGYDVHSILSCFLAANGKMIAGNLH